ncbi:MAG TPA: hypothetical protein VFO11_02830 [Candidatus Polarisedimenticolaceae bacterium]|nr:hypothetical protein [Candidatus Polarisedimenticolaceae bacterium]
MRSTGDKLVLWAPRWLGIAVCLFLALFALDAVGAHDFAFHIAPMALLLGIVLVSWKQPWLGGAVFTVLAFVYAYAARDRLDWVLCVSGPLLLVGVLFLWSWSRQRRIGQAAA